MKRVLYANDFQLKKFRVRLAIYTTRWGLLALFDAVYPILSFMFGPISLQFSWEND